MEAASIPDASWKVEIQSSSHGLSYLWPHLRALPIGLLAVTNEANAPLRVRSVGISSGEPFPIVPSGNMLSEDVPIEVGRTALLPLVARYDREVLRQDHSPAKCEVFVDVATDRGARRVTFEVPLRPPDFWPGIGFSLRMPSTIACWVTPQEPKLADTLNEARRWLRKQSYPSSLEGYQSGSPQRVRVLAQAGYEGLQRTLGGDGYIDPPPNFPANDGQRVMLPRDVVEQRQGTCIDLAVTMAALWERMGLAPVLVFMKGHAFAGVWLDEQVVPRQTAFFHRDFFSTLPPDLQQRHEAENKVVAPGFLVDRMHTGRLLLVDSSSVAMGRPFAHARREVERAAGDFWWVVNVRMAHVTSMPPFNFYPTAPADQPQPSPSPVVEPASVRIPGEVLSGDRADEGDRGAVEPPLGPPAGRPVEVVVDDQPLPAAPVVRPADLAGAPHELNRRLERWKARLLDLSLRNPLLNFPLAKLDDRQRPGSRGIGLVPMTPLALLEDELYKGKKFRLLPVVDTPNATEAFFVSRVRGGDVYYGPQPPNLVYRIAQRLYRTTAAEMEETGAPSLYLALGFLEFERPSDRSRKKAANGPDRATAPLVLVPISLEYDRRRGGWSFSASADEWGVNFTLLQFLEQELGVSTDSLKLPPTDEAGLDVPAIFDAFREFVAPRHTWQVLERAVIARFSFTKFLMWRDLQQFSDELARNPAVRAIVRVGADDDGSLEGSGTSSDAPSLPIDQVSIERSPRDVLTVVDADPSQLRAVCAALDGYSFVLQGPPGTGKSQTITNLVAALLGAGKSVLFVAEKNAALRVVYDRLSRVGLGGLCLELHADKASPAKMMESVRKSFEVHAARAPREWERTVERLQELRAELDAYVDVLRRPTPFGGTVHDVAQSLFDLRNAPRLDFEPAPSLDELTQDRVEAQEYAIEQLVRQARPSRWRPNHPLLGVRQRHFTPATKRTADEALSGALAALDALGEALSEETVARFVPPSVAGARAWIRFAECVAERPSPCRGDAVTLDPGVWRPQLRKLLELLEARHKLWSALAPRYEPEVLSLDVPRLRDKVRRWAHAFFLFAFFALFGVRWTLRRFARQALPPSRKLADDLDTAERVRELDRQIGAFDSLGRSLLGDAWKGAATDVETLRAVQRWLDFVAAVSDETAALRITGTARGDALRRLAGEDPERLQRSAARMREALALLTQHMEGVRTALQPDDNVFDENAPLDAWRDTLQRWHDNLDALRDWTHWQEAVHAALACGLSAAIEALDDGRIAIEDIAVAWRHGALQWYWDGLVDEHDCLASFHGRTREARIEEFAELDRRLFDLARQEVVARCAARMPPKDAPGEHMRLLRTQMARKRRHMPIRKLFARVGPTLRLLKPCVLMSPLSVARFLDPAAEPFDVVIFDEASQIAPWDALGAIGRGKQVVIVGDSKQLPPTTFFTAGVGDDIVPDDDIIDLDSILEEAMASGVPVLDLEWHYRSRHESLIAFSNRHYYLGKLATFPSAARRGPGLGVHLRYLPDAVYDRGRTRTNPREAQAVVEEIERRIDAAGGARLSIGVVAFSIAQQEAVQRYVDELVERRPELAPRFDPKEPEYIFIKNLESVQGDERDFILMTVGYGPDEDGKLSLNFGPLNGANGGRRLNVAITRARRELVVFTCLRPEYLPLEKCSEGGLADFRAWMEFLWRGVQEVESGVPAEHITGAPRELGDWLTEQGYDVTYHVGSSGFRIDLAVRESPEAENYLLGILFDGPFYYRADSTRERERQRVAVLEAMGWRLARVWTVDWWMDADGEKRRIAGLLEEARAAAKALGAAPGRPHKPRSQPTSRKIAATSAPMASADPSPVANPLLAKHAGSAPAGPASPPQAARHRSGSTHPNQRGPAQAPRSRAAALQTPSARTASKAQAGTGGSPSAGSSAPFQASAAESPREHPRFHLPQLPTLGDSEGFYDKSAVPVIARSLQSLVEAVGPIHRDRAYRMLVGQWGMTRLGSRVRTVLDHALARLSAADRPVVRDEFLWPARLDPATWEGYRVTPLGSDERPFDEIPLEEIRNVAWEVVREAFPRVDEEELKNHVVDRLGYQRLTKNVSQRIGRALDLLEQWGRCRVTREEGRRWFHNPAHDPGADSHRASR